MNDSPFSAKQLRALADSTRRVHIWDGAVRSGKTFAWTFLILGCIADAGQVGGIVIVGKNRDSVYRNVFEPIEQHPMFALAKPHVHYRQGAAFATIFGKKVHVVGANDAGAENRIRGMTLQLAFCDEVTVLHQQFFKQLLARLSVDGARLFGTTNPDTPGHWLMRDYLVKVPGQHFKPTTHPDEALTDWAYWHFTMEDNPSLNEDYKASLRREYTGVWYKRFILGMWVAADGAIYDFFDADVHTVDAADIPPIERMLALGIDYGTTHPTSGQLLGLGADKRLYVVDEWDPNTATGVLQKLTDRELADSLNTWLPTHQTPDWVYIDPAAGSFKEQIRRDRTWRAKNAHNDVLDGIRTVASLLANGQLLISRECKNLIQEIPGYRWDDKATERGEEKPIKQEDDRVDALRYAVYSSRKTWQRLLGEPI